MSSKSSNGNTGVATVFVLVVVFAVLKLTGVISWSWLWVLSPLWLGFMIGIAALGLLALFVMIGQASKR